MSRVDKPWGHEVIWSVTDRYAGKLLHIRKGHRLSLQAHRQKEESIYVLEGVLGLETVTDDGARRIQTLLPGQSAHIAPGTIHRFFGAEDCVLIEVSTPELDDVERFEDDYGRVGQEAA